MSAAIRLKRLAASVASRRGLEGTIDYAGGTGKYQGINGHNTFLGHIQVNWSDGTASGYSTINR